MTETAFSSLLTEAPARPRLLLALDCDGTLLDPVGRIRPRVRDALRAATEAGALVTLATARRLQAAKGFAEELGVRTPLVLQDGATVQDPITGALYHQDPLPSTLVVQLVELALAYELHPVVQRITADPTGDVIHVLDGVDVDPSMERYLSSRTPVVRGDRLALQAVGPAARFSAMGVESPVRRYYEHIKGRVEELCCNVYLTTPLAYTDYPYWAALVTNGGCSKASAVAALAQQHGLTLADCVAVGDGHNDIELLEQVRASGGISVAMGQAVAEVREAASYVVGTNEEDGVAEAIERFVFPRLMQQVSAKRQSS
ncbi:MAG TPA: HAD hydrolase family protein [Chloroflexota bacterium]|nr:HAD hydrolase family protein [Chloroflexota bacterium]